MFGDGQGVIMTDDGEMVSWNGQGVGRFTGHGTAGFLARGRGLPDSLAAAGAAEWRRRGVRVRNR